MPPPLSHLCLCPCLCCLRAHTGRTQGEQQTQNTRVVYIFLLIEEKTPWLHLIFSTPVQCRGAPWVVLVMDPQVACECDVLHRDDSGLINVAGCRSTPSSWRRVRFIRLTRSASTQQHTAFYSICYMIHTSTYSEYVCQKKGTDQVCSGFRSTCQSRCLLLFDVNDWSWSRDCRASRRRRITSASSCTSINNNTQTTHKRIKNNVMSAPALHR